MASSGFQYICLLSTSIRFRLLRACNANRATTPVTLAANTSRAVRITFLLFFCAAEYQSCQTWLHCNGYCRRAGWWINICSSSNHKKLCASITPHTIIYSAIHSSSWPFSKRAGRCWNQIAQIKLKRAFSRLNKTSISIKMAFFWGSYKILLKSSTYSKAYTYKITRRSALGLRFQTRRTEHPDRLLVFFRPFLIH